MLNHEVFRYKKIKCLSLLYFRGTEIENKFFFLFLSVNTDNIPVGNNT